MIHRFRLACLDIYYILLHFFLFLFNVRVALKLKIINFLRGEKGSVEKKKNYRHINDFIYLYDHNTLVSEEICESAAERV